MDIQRAFRLKPEAPAHFGTRGLINYGSGLFVEASSDLDKAIALDPRDGESHFFRAAIYEVSGDSELAMQEYAKAKELNFKLLSFSTINLSSIPNGQCLLLPKEQIDIVLEG